MKNANKGFLRLVVDDGKVVQQISNNPIKMGIKEIPSYILFYKSLNRSWKDSVKLSIVKYLEQDLDKKIL